MRTTLLLALLLCAACTHAPLKIHKGVAEASLADFLNAPERYGGRVVRLPGLWLARYEIRRPLVFTPPDRADQEIVVLDPRGLLHGSLPAPGAAILIQCTEGRTDRGNLLLAVEAMASPAPVKDNPLSPR